MKNQKLHPKQGSRSLVRAPKITPSNDSPEQMHATKSSTKDSKSNHSKKVHVIESSDEEIVDATQKLKDNALTNKHLYAVSYLVKCCFSLTLKRRRTYIFEKRTDFLLMRQH